MKASQMLMTDQLSDRRLAEEKGLIGSVMDYPAANLSHLGEPQGLYFTTRPGPYDLWAIEFGYGEMTDAERNRLLARSTEPELADRTSTRLNSRHVAISYAGFCVKE